MCSDVQCAGMCGNVRQCADVHWKQSAMCGMCLDRMCDVQVMCEYTKLAKTMRQKDVELVVMMERSNICIFTDN